METQIQSKEVAQTESALYTRCTGLYRKMFPKLEELGWEELEHYGFAVYSRKIEDVEYVLNMDMNQLLVTVPEQGETTKAKQLKCELEALPEWEELREPYKEWLVYFAIHKSFLLFKR